jgi:hypothetical protein
MKWLRVAFPAVVLLAGAVLLVAVQREPLEAQLRRPDKWEYKVIAMAPINAGEIESKLQSAGAFGWECVGTSFNSQAGTTTGVYLVLKRPK